MISHGQDATTRGIFVLHGMARHAAIRFPAGVYFLRLRTEQYNKTIFITGFELLTGQPSVSLWAKARVFDALLHPIHAMNGVTIEMLLKLLP